MAVLSALLTAALILLKWSTTILAQDQTDTFGPNTMTYSTPSVIILNGVTVTSIPDFPNAEIASAGVSLQIGLASQQLYPGGEMVNYVVEQFITNTNYLSALGVSKRSIAAGEGPSATEIASALLSEISAFYATSTVVGIASPGPTQTSAVSQTPARDPALSQTTTDCTTSLFPSPTSGATTATLPATTEPGYSTGISNFCNPTSTVSMLKPGDSWSYTLEKYVGKYTWRYYNFRVNFDHRNPDCINNAGEWPFVMNDTQVCYDSIANAIEACPKDFIGMTWEQDCIVWGFQVWERNSSPGG